MFLSVLGELLGNVGDAQGRRVPSTNDVMIPTGRRAVSTDSIDALPRGETLPTTQRPNGFSREGKFSLPSKLTREKEPGIMFHQMKWNPGTPMNILVKCWW